jgi:hypothetical protein
MPKPRSSRRPSLTPRPDRRSRPRPRRGVTSDPDRGVAVNSGTDPQRPGTPPRPVPDTLPSDSSAEEPSEAAENFKPVARPSTAGRNEDVEGSGKNEPDDPL